MKTSEKRAREKEYRKPILPSSKEDFLLKLDMHMEEVDELLLDALSCSGHIF
ncbi:hypothetical protein ACFRCQ_24100 [Cytobacillus firmus]|uniref:hypothetical protein n=1 Tax=Bacillaceae TaxID=186817 RepID=UPI001A8D8D8D|nr:hypothetical protein [Bacillus sp. NTK034]MBN8202600.1 hypothetical protein [Bacillus sp. NTK034]